MDEKEPEKQFAELMATFGSQALAQILNALEPIKQKRLDEIGVLDQEIAARREELVSVKRLVDDLGNKSAELGAQYLRLKEQRRRFILGEDLPDTAQFMSDVKALREQP
jgi:hypothetical protein